MKKITILIAGLMLSIITVACSKTAPEGETGIMVFENGNYANTIDWPGA